MLKNILELTGLDMEKTFDKFVITDDYAKVRHSVQHFHPTEIASFYGLKPHQWTSEIPKNRQYIRLGARVDNNYNLPLAIMEYYEKNIIAFEKWKIRHTVTKLSFFERIKFILFKELPQDFMERIKG